MKYYFMKYVGPRLCKKLEETTITWNSFQNLKYSSGILSPGKKLELTCGKKIENNSRLFYVCSKFFFAKVIGFYYSFSFVPKMLD